MEKSFVYTSASTAKLNGTILQDKKNTSSYTDEDNANLLKHNELGITHGNLDDEDNGSKENEGSGGN